MGYVKSKSIKVYPTGFRGYSLNDDNTIQVFDPESMLPVEDNLTRPYTVLSDYDGFVLPDSKIGTTDNSVFKFIYHGYFFEIKGIKRYGSWNNKTEIYAHVIVKAKMPNDSANNQTYIANSLSPIDSENQDNLDDSNGYPYDASKYDFVGLELNGDKDKTDNGDSNVGLLIAEKVDGSWAVPDKCKLKFKTSSIKGGTNYVSNADASLDKQLDTELVYSPNGVLTLQGESTVEIQAAAGDESCTEFIELDKKSGKITINATKVGEGTIELHATKDIVEQVDANETVTVSGNSTSTVEGTDTEKITGNKSITTKKKLTLKSESSDTATADNGVEITSAQDVKIQAGSDINIQSPHYTVSVSGQPPLMVQSFSAGDTRMFPLMAASWSLGSLSAPANWLKNVCATDVYTQNLHYPIYQHNISLVLACKSGTNASYCLEVSFKYCDSCKKPFSDTDQSYAGQSSYFYSLWAAEQDENITEASAILEKLTCALKKVINNPDWTGNTATSYTQYDTTASYCYHAAFLADANVLSRTTCGLLFQVERSGSTGALMNTVYIKPLTTFWDYSEGLQEGKCTIQGFVHIACDMADPTTLKIRGIALKLPGPADINIMEAKSDEMALAYKGTSACITDSVMIINN